MAQWYYAVDQDRRGPVEAAEIERLMTDGRITAETLVWREGLVGWEAASNHFPSGRTPPPLSPGQAAAAAPALPHGAGAPGSSGSPGAPAAASGPSDQIGSDGLYVGAPSRGFGEAISTCFSKYATFRGRASRSEYWFFVLFIVLASIVATIIDAILFPGSLESGGPFNGILTIATLLPSLAVGWRRLHDTDRSGWWIGGFYLALFGVGLIVAVMISGGAGEEAGMALLGLVGIGVLAYVIVILVFFCQRGTLGPNRFG